MNTIVQFPILNLKLNIEKIAFSLFGIEIYWYSILIIAGIIIGVIISKIRNGLYDIKYSDVIDLLIYLIPISIISARLYYIIFNLEYYLKTPAQIINLRTGGLAIYGGIIGGLITCIIFCKKRNIKILNILDYMAPAVAIRSSNRQMGKFYEYRSIWKPNITSMEDGNI